MGVAEREVGDIAVAEQTAPPPPAAAGPDPEALARAKAARRARILGDLDIRGKRCLEYGPLHQPFLFKDECDVLYVDYLSTEGLKKKYAHQPDVVANIVPIDYTLEEFADKRAGFTGTFDVIFASHVFEHLANPIAWLLEQQPLLSPKGRLVLVIPDKRFTFDALRRPSSYLDLARSFAEKRTRPGLECVLDHHLNAVKVNPAELWKDYSVLRSKPRLFTEPALVTMVQRHMKGEYLEVHSWAFLPWTFLQLVADMNMANDLCLAPAYFSGTGYMQIDFVAHLEKAPKAQAIQRCRTQADFALKTAEFPPNYFTAGWAV